MKRWEFVQGRSSKFWEIEVKGGSLTTRYGRIGSTPQSTTKKLGSPAAAKKAYAALVAAKEAKGYRPARAATATQRPASVRPRPSTTKRGKSDGVAATLDALEGFLAALTSRPALLVTLYERKRVHPVAAAEIARFEKRTGRSVPADVRALYLRGVSTGVIEGDKGRGYGRLDFQPLAAIAAQLKWWTPEEGVEGDADPGLRLRGEQRRHGLPLWDDESTIVVDSRTGAVGRISGEPTPSDMIAPSFGEFLVHYVASGCFHCGTAERSHFAAYWKLIGDIVPFGIAPAKNLWLRHLDRWYRGNLTGPKSKTRR